MTDEERQYISDLINGKIAHIGRDGVSPHMIRFSDANGRTMFIVSEEHLFDGDGFLFNTEELA